MNRLEWKALIVFSLLIMAPIVGLFLASGCGDLDRVQEDAARQTNSVVQSFGPLALAYSDAMDEVATKKSQLHRDFVRVQSERWVEKYTDAATGNVTTRPADFIRMLSARDAELLAIAENERRVTQARLAFRQGLADLLAGVELATQKQVDAFEVKKKFTAAIQNLAQAIAGGGAAVGTVAIAGGL